MNIFLATPISSYSDIEEMNRDKKYIRKLIRVLKRKKYTIFNELESINDINDYDTPESSFNIDLGEIKKSDVFVLYYPHPMATSALIELGIAIAENKPVIIISQKSVLPYLAHGLLCSNRALIIECEVIDDFCITQILKKLELIKDI